MLGAIGSSLSAVMRDLAGRAVAFRAVCWLVAGSWGTWALVNDAGPWDVNVALTLFGGGIVAAAAAGVLPDTPRAPAQESQPTGRLADVWVQLLEGVCRIRGARVLGIEQWPSPDGTRPPGYTVEARLPADGTTWKLVKSREDGLAAALRLAEGCSVEVLPGVEHGVALINVSTRNALAEPVPYPTDYAHRSINNPIWMGRHTDASATTAQFRQDSAHVVGQKRSGKTNTLNVIIAGHLLTVDNIPLVIDYNGGGLAMPWLLAWRTHHTRVTRPPIPWVAREPVEALMMTEWLLDVARDRKTAYAHLKFQHNTTLLPINEDLPQFTIFTDEYAEIGGAARKSDPVNRKVQANIEELQRIAGDSGVNVVFSSLAATVDMTGSRSVKAQSAIRIGMRVSDQEELAYLFGDYHLDLSMVRHQGSGFIKAGSDAVTRPFKAALLEPAQLTDVVIAAADGRRPEPDARALALPERVVTIQDTTRDLQIRVGPAGYTQAWDRAADWIVEIDGQLGLTPATDLPDRQRPTAADPAVTEERSADTVAEMRSSTQQLDAATDRMRQAAADADAKHATNQAPGPAPETQPDVETLNAMYRMPAVEPHRPASSRVEQSRPAAQIRALDLLAAAGADGTGATQIARQLQAEGYRTNRVTVQGWLDAWIREGRAVQPGGERTPYYAPQHAPR